MMLLLQDVPWQLEYQCTVKRVDGVECDMYILAWFNNEEKFMVTIGVPKGRADVAEFIERACIAGRRVLRECGEFNT